MWKEVALKKAGAWPTGVRLPIIISVHHQSEEACVMLPDGRLIRATTMSGSMAAAAAPGVCWRS